MRITDDINIYSYRHLVYYRLKSAIKDIMEELYKCYNYEF